MEELLNYANAVRRLIGETCMQKLAGALRKLGAVLTKTNSYHAKSQLPRCSLKFCKAQSGNLALMYRSEQQTHHGEKDTDPVLVLSALTANPRDRKANLVLKENWYTARR